ncbi:inter-alpha-trypsin inhibitor-like isoform X2 [Mixophyes fleayi]|uniref:inter-alpha-trypsin inhibitor-like isoform X2 n=1 Tax=Mixophyes fleayi TaxID=3061075 RepID=UPI003F4DBF14
MQEDLFLYERECDILVVEDSGAGSEMRWTYDKSEKLCKIIQHKNPGNGSNSFVSEKECLRRCSQEYNVLYPPGEAVCDLPQDSGPCMALILMWSYDKKRQVCDTFFYGGCKGNGNRFDNKEECKSICVIPKQRKSGVSDTSEETSDSQSDAGLITGIVFGCVFGAAFIVTLGMYLVQRNKLKKQQHKLVPDTEMK